MNTHITMNAHITNLQHRLVVPSLSALPFYQYYVGDIDQNIRN